MLIRSFFRNSRRLIWSCVLITVSFAAANAQQREPPPRELPIGRPVSSTIDTSDPVAEGRHFEVFRLRLEAGEGVRLEMRSTGFDTYLEVLGEGAAALAVNDDAALGNLNSRLYFTAESAGIYRVRASGFGGQTGNYMLVASRTPPAPPPSPLSDAPVQGELGEGSPIVDESRSFGDEYRYMTYTFVGRAGERIELEMTAAGVDPRLHLFTEGQEGFSVESGLNSGGFSTTIGAVLPRTGRYLVRAEGPVDQSGVFTLQLKRLGPAVEAPPLPLEWTVPLEKSLSLATSSAQVGESGAIEFLYDLYSISVDAGDVISVDVTAEGHLPYLDAGGLTPLGYALATSTSSFDDVLTLDDEVPTGPNVRLRLELRPTSPGEVVLRVRSEEQSGGGYTIVARRTR